MQGIGKTSAGTAPDMGLGIIEHAFPAKRFPTAAIHEFISPSIENAAATNGFISAILGKMMQQGGNCLWISNRRSIFPPALKLFGIDAERVVFIDLQSQRDVLWAIEEALKCEPLAAVVGELKELNFTESRRLQLAVEQSKVTGFIHRYQPRSENIVACVTRWKITPLPSLLEDGMPGVGFPRWNVHLAKVRNGKPGTWQVEWGVNGFHHIPLPSISISAIHKRKTG